MTEPTKISGAVRLAAAARVRRDKMVPAVLYGHGLPSETIQVETQQFEKVFRRAGATSLITLILKKQEHPVIIRDVQYHPLRGTIQHVDFYQVRLDEVIKAEVPLVLVGEAVAVKDLGGVLVRNVDELSIEALPKDLPHNIAVNISSLDAFEKVIRVKDLNIPKGVKVLADAETVVTLVQAPRSEEEIEALKTEVKEDVQSVEGMKTKAEQEKAAEATGETPAVPTPEVAKKEEKKEKK